MQGKYFGKTCKNQLNLYYNCFMKSKIYQKKANNKPSSFETDIKTKDPKSLKVEVSSFLYNDF